MHFLKTIFPAFILFVTSVSLVAQNWRQQVDYQIDVRLDDQTNSVQVLCADAGGVETPRGAQHGQHRLEGGRSWHDPRAQLIGHGAGRR